MNSTSKLPCQNERLKISRENLFSFEATNGDYFKNLVAFSWPVFGLIGFLNVVMIVLLPLSYIVIKYEHNSNRTQTLMTRINTTTIAIFIIVNLPHFLLDTMRYFAGISYPPILCFYHIAAKVFVDFQKLSTTSIKPETCLLQGMDWNCLQLAIV